jgi:hypothetical protein|tara:strand:- start:1518 stop:1793 length:276 start_codon:yes stop_codon:yes gene_type:complete
LEAFPFFFFFAYFAAAALPLAVYGNFLPFTFGTYLLLFDARRPSDSAIAIACLRLLTFGPFLLPDRKPPFLNSRMTFDAFFFPRPVNCFPV